MCHVKILSRSDAKLGNQGQMQGIFTLQGVIIKIKKILQEVKQNMHTQQRVKTHLLHHKSSQ
jgi:hypothetical protein